MPTPNYISSLDLDGTERQIKDANAVSVVSDQGLTTAQKEAARDNIGLGSAATYDVPTSGNASASQVVLGNDTRLGGGGGGSDKAYQTDDTTETTLADGDYFPFYDVSATGKRKTTWSNIVAKIKAALSNATQSVAGLMSSTDKTKLDGIDTGANNYSLPLAASGTRGGIQLGYTQSGKYYPVRVSNEKAYVYVPWSNTTYSVATTSSNGLMSSKDKAKLAVLSTEYRNSGSVTSTSSSSYKRLATLTNLPAGKYIMVAYVSINKNLPSVGVSAAIRNGSTNQRAFQFFATNGGGTTCTMTIGVTSSTNDFNLVVYDNIGNSATISGTLEAMTIGDGT